MAPSIIVIGGIPCSGKSTLATALSKELNIPAFSKDTIEAAIVRKGLTTNKNMHGVGYEIMKTLAKSFIESKCSVIFDFIATQHRVNEYWPELYNENIKYIECFCSDDDLHKERAQSRERNIEGWYELSWADIMEIKAHYKPLLPERIVLDSASTLATNLTLAKEFINR